jgi:hypothetical protein
MLPPFCRYIEHLSSFHARHGVQPLNCFILSLNIFVLRHIPTFRCVIVMTSETRLLVKRRQVSFVPPTMGCQIASRVVAGAVLSRLCWRMPFLVEEGFTFATFLMLLARALPSRMAEEAYASRGGACPCGRPRGWVAALARGCAACLAFANKVLKAGAVWMSGGDASPCDLPDCEAVDARASLARRVGASVAHAHPGPFPVSTRFLVKPSSFGSATLTVSSQSKTERLVSKGVLL